MAKLLKIIIIFTLTLSSYVLANDEAIVVSAPQEKYFNDDKVRPSLYKTYAKEIAEVENYLNSFETFIAQFKQSNKEGSIRYGKLLISKPGKIRCEYLKPSPILLIINDNRLTYYDQDLDEVSYSSSDINVLKLLAQSEINFNNLDLVEVDKEKQFITLSIKEGNKKSSQRLFLTLKFSYPSIELVQITITTEENEIDIIFDQIIYNQAIGKQLFYFHRDIFRNRR